MLRILMVMAMLVWSMGAKAQFMSKSQEQALDSLHNLRDIFKTCSNDSVFISQYSEDSYRYYFFVRGDLAEDIEEQIYSTPVGGVAGPFRGEGSSNFLFKVVGFDGSAERNKATLIYLKPEKANTDSIALKKLAKKYSDVLAKGKNAKDAAEKDKVRLVFSDLKYYYEDQKMKSYYDLVINGKKGETFIVNTERGPAILYITGEKEKVPYKVKLIAVVKKG